MEIKAIVDEYFRKFEHEHYEAAKVAMSVRVAPEVKERLERIAKDVGESMNTVVADLLAYASIELASEIASRSQDPKRMFFWLAYGKKEDA